MGFFLGIDAGGSKTECVLADEAGVVSARATGGGANLRRVSKTQLRAVLGGCIEQLRRTVGVPAIAAEAVCGGFAGAGQEEARSLAQEVLTELLHPRQLYVVGDMEVALEAAVGAGPGIVLVAGTGSIAYGRNSYGQQARAGGGGPDESDEGSGFDIGRRAVEAARRVPRRAAPATGLADYVCRSLKVERSDELERFLREQAPEELAALVPVVAQAAGHGDRTAHEILEQAAADLVGLALEVLQELGLLESEVRVATTGGVFAAAQEVFVGVRARIAERAPKVAVEPLRVTPAEGAVQLAQRLWLQEKASAPTAE
jgi:glucosamine kinase